MNKSLLLLFIIQVANYGIPLLTLPWITRALGPERYGEMNFIISVIAYFVMLSDYGFALSATRDISINRNDSKKISQIFKSVLFIKFIFAIFGYLIILVYFFFLKENTLDLDLWSVAYGLVIGGVLTLNWYYQGLEKLASLALITISIRIIALPLTYFYIKTSNDLMHALAINSAIPMVAGGISYYYIKNEIFDNKISLNLNYIIEKLKNGWPTFISSIARSMYTTTNIVILGILGGNEMVGYFTAAEKVMAVPVVLFATLLQISYARIGYLMKYNNVDAKIFLNTLLKITIFINALIAIFILCFSDLIIQLLYGSKYSEAVFLLKGLSLIPLISAISNIFGVQTLLNLGLEKDFGRIVVKGGVVNLIALIPLAYYFGAIGVVISFNLTEIFVLISMYRCLKFNGWIFAWTKKWTLVL